MSEFQPRSVTRMKATLDSAWAYDRIFELESEVKHLREDYRELLLAIHSVQHEALQEYLNSSVDGKRTIDAARTWVRANRHRTLVDEEQG